MKSRKPCAVFFFEAVEYAESRHPANARTQNRGNSQRTPPLYKNFDEPAARVDPTAMKQSILAGVLALTGCATGAPALGRHTLDDGRYQPFARAAAPREIPLIDPAAAASPSNVIKPGARDTAVSAARSLVGKRQIQLSGKRWGDDCTGLVRGVYAQVGVDLLGAAQPGDNGVTAIWRYAAAHGRHYDGGRPVEGDLVFFKETYDLNRDGRTNDGLTHVGLVDEVLEDGTVVVIHRVARGVVRYRMNLAQPARATNDSGRLINDYLRLAGTRGQPQLTGQLFAGYATLLPVEPRLAASGR